MSILRKILGIKNKEERVFKKDKNKLISTTLEDMATGFYHATISYTNKEPLRDGDDNIILTKKEKATLLASYLCDLLEVKNLKKAQIYIVTAYVVNNFKSKKKDDLMVEMAIAFEHFKKINSFFKNIPQEDYKFFKQKFLFNKDLNPVQKISIMTWYTTQCESISSAFESSIKKVKIVDKE